MKVFVCPPSSPSLSAREEGRSVAVTVQKERSIRGPTHPREGRMDGWKDGRGTREQCTNVERVPLLSLRLLPAVSLSLSLFVCL